MTMPIEQAAINLAVALGLSAVIGFERQWRNRLAGLRTNTLVSLGAATFVIFAAVVPGDASPTRVAAQVVSGIGFLGAGLIFREGLNVRGLNTAATLWCSAAIGALAGATAQELKDTICVQGTYSIPCAKIIWCPAAKCGIGIALPDGDLDVVYSSEPSISGTRRRLWQAGSAMSLQHLTGRVIVFELDDSPPIRVRISRSRESST